MKMVISSGHLAENLQLKDKVEWVLKKVKRSSVKEYANTHNKYKATTSSNESEFPKQHEITLSKLIKCIKYIYGTKNG